MLNHQKTVHIGVVCLLLLAGGGLNACAQDAAAAAEDPLLSKARQTYERAVKDYIEDRGSGLSQLELINTWSIRIWAAQVQKPALEGLATNRAEVAVAAQKEHVARMTKLKNMVKKQVDVGLRVPSNLAAAEYFELAGQKLTVNFAQATQTLADRVIDAMNQIEQPPAIPKPIAAQPDVIIQIDSRGKLFIDQKEVDEKKITAILDKLPSESASVVIEADPDSMFQSVVAVMDICRRSGVENCSMKAKETAGDSKRQQDDK